MHHRVRFPRDEGEGLQQGFGNTTFAIESRERTDDLPG